jgi:hypothetical protein
MNKFLALFARHWAKNRVKLILTLTAVALGTGILILSFTASLLLKEQVSDELARNGSILYVANGTWGSDGTIEQERPSEWDSAAPSLVAEGGYTITGAVPITMPPFDEIRAGDKSYRLRSAVGTAPGYFEITGLEIIHGSPMTEEDISLGSKKVWLSRETAELLFGSAAGAVGQRVQPPGMAFGRGMGRDRQQNLIVSYTVAGVFENPSEVARRTYGLGDLVLPYSALIPAGGNAQMMLNFMSGLFMIGSTEPSVEKAAAEVSGILASAYGEDTQVTVWEGTPRGVSTYYEELRQAVSIFTVAVNILGMVLLVTSSLGIFSIMVVESLSRRRDIALERALGASQGAVVREFWSWSFALSLLGGVLGLLLALILAGPVFGTIAPLLGELSGALTGSLTLNPLAVLGGLALAMGCGGVLGLLPAVSAVQGGIADVLREA